jgi:hypothetical protein
MARPFFFLSYGRFLLTRFNAFLFFAHGFGPDKLRVNLKSTVKGVSCMTTNLLTLTGILPSNSHMLNPF